MDAHTCSRTSGEGPLAIVCGGGTLPLTVADSAVRHGRRVVLFPVRGWADPAPLAAWPHHWISVAQAGRFRKLARREGCRDIVFLGGARRPPIATMRFDWLSLILLPRIFAIYRGGDDHLLRGIARIFEDHGFRLVAPQDIAPDIVAPAGPLGGRVPAASDLADIAKGLAVLAALGTHDIGQAVVVANRSVLAVEAVEGTDGMLMRIAELRRQGRIATPTGVGVLVKAPKAGQDRRLDLPTIGPVTVDHAARAGLAGIAFIAGQTLVAEPQAVAAAADRAGIFVVGVADDARS